MQTGALNSFLPSLPLQLSNAFSIALNGQYHVPWSWWRQPPMTRTNHSVGQNPSLPSPAFTRAASSSPTHLVYSALSTAAPLAHTTSAAIVQGGVANGSLDTITNDIDWKSELPIALLSFQSAGQIVGSRVLNLAEVPTVVLISMLHDVATDPKLLASPRTNVKRNRRVLAFLGFSLALLLEALYRR